MTSHRAERDSLVLAFERIAEELNTKVDETVLFDAMAAYLESEGFIELLRQLIREELGS